MLHFGANNTAKKINRLGIFKHSGEKIGQGETAEAGNFVLISYITMRYKQTEHTLSILRFTGGKPLRKA